MVAQQVPEKCTCLSGKRFDATFPGLELTPRKIKEKIERIKFSYTKPVDAFGLISMKCFKILKK